LLQKIGFMQDCSTFKTQFTTGYDYKTDTSRISDFMAPGYLITAIGMDYKPNNKFTAFITPLSGRYIHLFSIKKWQTVCLWSRFCHLQRMV
jgi:hypothetical protein